MPERIAYKYLSGDQLHLDVFRPRRQCSEHVSAIVFFFGGGFRGGSTAQFHPQAGALADRGMAAFCADYRVATRHGTTPLESLKDAKSAIRWIRRHAAAYGVDPDRVVAAGGSAGGYLALAAAMVDDVDEDTDDPAVSAIPDALVLFNPAVNLDSGKIRDRFPDLTTSLKRISPMHRVKEGLPPTIIFHGAEDRVVPFESVQRFTRRMRSAGNRCTLVSYPGEGHGFFNHPDVAPRFENTEAYRDTLARTDDFLCRYGFLRGRTGVPG